MSNENAPLISTLRSLQLKALKETSVGQKIAPILDRSVYNALFPRGASETAEDMLQEDEWDENETLLALAGRASDRPLRAWLGVAVDHQMISETQANAMHKALRDRYGPLSDARQLKQKLASSPISLAPSPTAGTLALPFQEKGSNIFQRVCRQCRRDHQRCDRAGGKHCKRCIEHGWNCAESIPRTPVGVAKRRRADEEPASKRSRAPTPPEDEDEEDMIEEGESLEAPASAELVEEQGHGEEALEEAASVAKEQSSITVAETQAQNRRSISVASSSKSRRRQRSSSSASNRDEKPTLRELRTLERETQIPGSKRKRQTSAVDVALDKMGLRKTAANIAFLTEAGLISPEIEDAPTMGLIPEDVAMEEEADEAEDSFVQSSMAVDNVESKAVEDDESVASSHEADSFFDSAVGTPATVSDPQGESAPSTACGPSTSIAAPVKVGDVTATTTTAAAASD